MRTIRLTISDTASAVIQRLKPAVLMPVIAREIDKQNVLTVSHIQRTYLSFPKQAPTTLEGLRARSTPGFRGTLYASEATVSGDQIESAIGSPINKGGFSYPALHEFGGTVHRKPRAGVVRLRTDAKGNLVRQAKNGKLAVFARKSHSRAKEVSFQGKAHDAVYPARRSIQRGIEDRLEKYNEAISARIIQFAEGGS